MLTRRTPLKRTEFKRTVPMARTDLAASGQPKPRSRLQPRSKKMAAVYVERRTMVVEYLAGHPQCQIRYPGICWGRSTCVHERLSRSRSGNTAKVILDESLFVAACGPCNSNVDCDMTGFAQEHDLLRNSWDPKGLMS